MTPSGSDAPTARPAARPRRLRPAAWLVRALDRVAPSGKDRLQRRLIRLGYEVINRRDRDSRYNCLNYGWATLDGDVAVGDIGTHDPDRRGLALYHQVASAVNLAGRDVLEVGCGRGAGAAHVRRSLGAASVTGLDLTRTSIDWARRRYGGEGLRFIVGDAEALPFPDATFDAVLNVESSHNYPHVDRFLGEVRRVLRPGGHLALADLRPAERVQELRDEIAAAGLDVREEEDITANVVRSLDLDDAARRQLIDEGVPRFFRPAARDFMALVGTEVYESLRTRRLIYLRLVCERPLTPT